MNPLASSDFADGPAATAAATLSALSRLLDPDPAVRAVVVAGSGADVAALDRWSDLDVVVVVSDAAVSRFFPETAWLLPLGRIYAVDRSSGPDRSVLRICFADLRRLDVLLVPESALPAFTAADGPLQGGARVVLDRTGRMAEVLRQVTPGAPPAPADADVAFRRMEDEFRWAGVVAAAKVGRGDLLIGAHLALEMAQHCLVLGMLLRDRATGTRHHRFGGPMPAAALGLRLPESLSGTGIVALMRSSVAAWTDLARRWDPEHHFDAGPLLALCDAACPGDAGGLRGGGRCSPGVRPR